MLRHKWLVLAVVVVFTAAAYVRADRQAPVYEASTKLLLSGSAGTGNALQTSFGLPVSDREIQDQATLLTAQDVREAVTKRLGRPAPGASASVLPDSSFITVSVRDSSGRRAAEAANAYVQAFIDLRTEAERRSISRAIETTRAQLDRLPGGPRNAAQRAEFRDTIRRLQVTLATSTGSASQVDPAVAPTSPSGPHPRRDAALAFLVALVGAIGLAFALEALNRRLTRLEDFPQAYGLPLLGVVPRTSEGDFEVDGRSDLGPSLKEPFRQLRTAIQLAAIDAPYRRILVTSAIAGEGKSTVVRNLAIVLHEAGLQVAVVDSDLRRPALARLFHAQPTAGMTDVLTGRETIDGALVRVPVSASQLPIFTGDAIAGNGSGDEAHARDALALLASGPAPADPQTVLGAVRTKQLLQDLEERHDVVLIDSPPLLHVSDAATLAASVDAVIVVGRLGLVTRDQAERVAETLARVPGADPIGLVVTDVSASEGHGYGYGYGYPS